MKNFFSGLLIGAWIYNSCAISESVELKTVFLFESERLYFREFTERDQEALVPILGDKEVMEYCVSYPELKKIFHAFSSAEISAFITRVRGWYKEYGFGWFAVVKKDDNALIGFCGLKMHEDEGKMYPMLGYRLATQYWHYGYATEAAQAILVYAHDVLKLSEIIAIIDPSNTKSINVAHKAGLSFWKIGNYYDFPLNFYTVVFEK